LASTIAAAAADMARLFGFSENETEKFGQSTVGFFLYLCEHLSSAGGLRLTISDGGTYVRAAFRFRAGASTHQALSLVAGLDGDTSRSDDAPPMRMPDRCSLEPCGNQTFDLVSEVDRSYPEGAPMVSSHALCRPISIIATEADAASAGRLQQAAMLATGRYPTRACQSSLFRPGLFADLVATGQYQALLAVDGKERLAGMLCWSRSSRNAVAFCGPYVFDPIGDAPVLQETAELLTERFLATVARTDAVCAFSERPTADVPAGWFERLGTLDLHGEGSTGSSEQSALFRHLREDMGGTVWAHPDHRVFLEARYDDLALSRDILDAAASPASRLPEHALLATTHDHRRHLRILRPILDGQDFAVGLASQTVVTEPSDGQGVDILLHLDLSAPWQAARMPDIAACGFVPRFVLPYAGASDVLVYQHL
jgi:hypothetical protein